MKSLRENVVRFCVCVLFLTTPLVADTMPAAGPQFQVPGDPFCSVSAPQAALFDGREIWAWSQGGMIDPAEIGGAVFPPGGVTPTVDSLVLGDAPTGEMRLAQRGEVAWAAWPTASGIALRELTPEGDPLTGTQVTPDLEAPVESVDLAVTPSGRVFVVWSVTPDDPDAPRPVIAQLFRADGSEATEAAQIDVAELGNSQTPTVVAVAPAEDRFAVVWDSFSDTEGTGIFARSVLALATPGAFNSLILMPEERILVNDGSAQVPLGASVESPPEAASTPLGGFAVAWNGNVQVDPPFPQTFLRRFDAQGQPLGPEQTFVSNDLVPVSRSRPGLAVDGQGAMVLTWEAFIRDFSGPPGAFFRPIAATLLDVQGVPSGEIFQVNDTSDLVHRNPSPAFGPDDDLLITWDEGPEQSPLSAAPPCTGVGNFVLGRRFDTGCSDTGVCLRDNRFEVTVAWDDPFNGGSGVGTGLQLTGDTGAFWFFEADNLELMVKVLDGTSINGHYWVFFGSLTNVEFTLTVRDRLTGEEKSYVNAPFTFASVGDTMAFDATP